MRIKELIQDIKDFQVWRQTVKKSQDYKKSADVDTQTMLLTYSINPNGDSFQEVFNIHPQDLAQKIKLTWDNSEDGTTTLDLILQPGLFTGTEVLALACTGMLDLFESAQTVEAAGEALRTIKKLLEEEFDI